jgi:hypothetical protein
MRSATIGAVFAGLGLAICGCGGAGTTNSHSTPLRTQHAVSGFRAGQYCLPSKEQKYASLGFVCRRHHLMRG